MEKGSVFRKTPPDQSLVILEGERRRGVCTQATPPVRMRKLRRLCPVTGPVTRPPRAEHHFCPCHIHTLSSSQRTASPDWASRCLWSSRWHSIWGQGLGACRACSKPRHPAQRRPGRGSGSRQAQVLLPVWLGPKHHGKAGAPSHVRKLSHHQRAPEPQACSWAPDHRPYGETAWPSPLLSGRWDPLRGRLWVSLTRGSVITPRCP